MQTINCTHCNAELLRHPHTIGDRNFCNSSCFAKYTNPGRITKRSVIEICHCCNKEYRNTLSESTKSTSGCCSKKCKMLLHRQNQLPAFERGEISNRATITKLLLIRGVPYQCNLCGTSKWMGERLSLNLDHIDGCAANNLPSNFRFLCPNCDAQSPFHKGRNKGRGRKSLGLN